MDLWQHTSGSANTRETDNEGQNVAGAGTTYLDGSRNLTAASESVPPSPDLARDADGDGEAPKSSTGACSGRVAL